MLRGGKCSTSTVSMSSRRTIILTSTSRKRIESSFVRLRIYPNSPGRRTQSRSSSSSSSTTTTTTVAASNNDTTRTPPDYLTNDGIIEGVWMFCRHGDRTPSRALSPAHRREEEAAYWMTKLPWPDSAAAFEAYSKYFPLQVISSSASSLTNNNNNDHNKSNYNTSSNKTATPSITKMHQGQFIDVHRNPFGFLTLTGLLQLKESGDRFFNRYNHHGYHIQQQQYEDQDSVRYKEFLSTWNLKVYSTNYLRTVMSVQSFLDGLLGTNAYPPPSIEDNTTMIRPHDPTVTKEQRVPHHDWIKEQQQQQQHNEINSHVVVPIQVRDLVHDPLNAFDRNPDLIADLVSEILLSPDFQKKDGAAAPLAARLANLLPGLVRPHRAGSSDFSRAAPSRINWVEAADHFVCRQAHKVPLARFTDFELDDGRTEVLLQSLAHPTLSHLCWRFRQWYQKLPLLAAIAAPPLREIATQMQATPALQDTDRRPFVIYSCHDITILGLLYGMGADFLANEASGEWKVWPTYGSTLIFELVRIQNDNHNTPYNHKNSNGGGDGAESHVIRMLLNGKPVLSVRANSAQQPEQQDNAMASSSSSSLHSYVGRGPQHMLYVSDFLKVVSQLEEAGGHDYASLLGYKK